VYIIKEKSPTRLRAGLVLKIFCTTSAKQCRWLAEGQEARAQ